MSVIYEPGGDITAKEEFSGVKINQINLKINEINELTSLLNQINESHKSLSVLDASFKQHIIEEEPGIEDL